MDEEILNKIESNENNSKALKMWPGLGFYYDEKEEIIWFCTYWDCFLCAYSIRQKRTVKLEWIPDDTENRALLFSDIKRVGNVLVLIPCWSKSLFFYDLKNNEFDKITIEDIANLKYDRCGFAEVYDDNLYIFPYYGSSIFKVDVINKTYNEVISVPTRMIHENEISRFQTSHCVEGSCVYFLSSVSNSVYKFNMKDYTLGDIPLGDSDMVFNTVSVFAGNKIILSTQDGKIVIGENDNKDMYTIHRMPNHNIVDAIEKRGPAYIDSVVVGDKVIIFPNIAGNIIEISMNPIKIDEITIPELNHYEDYVDGWRVEGFSNALLVDRRIIVFSRRKGLLIIAEDDFRNPIMISIEGLRNIEEYALMYQNVDRLFVYENNNMFSLKPFLCYLAMDEDERRKKHGYI